MPTYSARVEYTATGGETEFAFAFGYLEEAQVKLYINDVVDSSATLQNNNPDSGGEIVPSVTINASDAIVVVRETPSGLLVDYQNAAALTEADLDLAYRHGLYVAEEAEDTAAIAETTAGATTATVAAAEAAAQAAQAAAESAQTAAETAETNASTSASNAATSETNAAASAVAAQAAVGGVAVSANDTTTGNLEAKVLGGTGITLSTQNDGGNETRMTTVDTTTISPVSNLNLNHMMAMGAM